MQSRLNELKQLCDGYNEQVERVHRENCAKCEKLQKRYAALRIIKIFSFVLGICGISIIAYFLMKYDYGEVPEIVDEIAKVVTFSTLPVVLVFFLVRKIMISIKTEILCLETSLESFINWLGRDYITKVFYPYLAINFFDGEYQDGMMKEELEDSNVWLPKESTFYGGISGVYKNMYFKENHVNISYSMLNKTENLFDGTVIQIDNPKPCAEPVYVTNNDKSLLVNNKPVSIKIDNKDFRENIEVGSNDSISAFKILSPKYMEKLFPYIKKDGMIAHIVYGKDKIIVFVNKRLSEHQYTPSYPFDIEQCYDRANEMSNEIKHLIREINDIVAESLR